MKKTLTRILAVIGVLSTCSCVSIMIIAKLGDDADTDATSAAAISQAPDPSATSEPAIQSTHTPIYPPTRTPRPGPTSTPLPTQSPTPTLTPVEFICDSMTRALGPCDRYDDRVGTCQLTPDGQFQVTWALSEQTTDYAVGIYARDDLGTILFIIDGQQIDYTSIRAQGSYPVTDAYGNEAEAKVVDVTYTKSTIDKINWKKFTYDNVFFVADAAEVDPRLLP